MCFIIFQIVYTFFFFTFLLVVGYFIYFNYIYIYMFKDGIINFTIFIMSSVPLLNDLMLDLMVFAEFRFSLE